MRPPRSTRGAAVGLLLVCIGLLGAIVPGCTGDGSGQGVPYQGESALGLAQRVADTWIQSVAPEQNDWSWGDGVLMFGMSRLAARTGDPGYWAYLQDWMDDHLEQGYYLAFSDHCPPGIAAVRLYEHTGDPRYHAVTERIWNYLENVAARTSDGGLNHMGFVTGRQLWVDSLFMFGVVLNEMARQEGDPAYWEELLDQLQIFSSHLRDETTGLFRHMWDDRTKKVKPEEAIFWARGNSWVFATLAEVLSILPEEHPRRAEPLTLLAAMAESLAAYQDPSGLWHTLVNDPDTYLETSASALFAYGFQRAMTAGVLPAEYVGVVRRAVSGLQTRLLRGCRGGLIVFGTSHGTSPGDRAYYANVTVGDQVPYGVGAVLLAFTEVGELQTTGSFPGKQGCPQIPDDPLTAEDRIARAVYRLEGADLEGAHDDFLAASDLAPDEGEGPFGAALIDVIFTAFKVYDAFTRFSIEELSWPDFQAVIQTEVLPELNRIQEKVSLAQQAPGFSLAIPVLQINRRGMYTPFLDLNFDSQGAADFLVLLKVLEALLEIIP